MNFTIDIALPIAALVVLTIAMPFVWSLLLPEGIPGLIANFLLSALVISLAVWGYFILWHMEQNGAVGAAIREQPDAFWVVFLGWAGKSAIIWLPILVLSVAAQPKRWKDVVW